MALSVEVTKLIAVALTTEEGRDILQAGWRALAWLSSDDSLLTQPREQLSPWMRHLEQSVAIDLRELANVDDETFKAADKGDRAAMWRMTRNLWIKQAAIEAIASPRPWTDWMLRVIGCATEQAISDLLGVIDSSFKRGLLSKAEAEALDLLIEQYVRPGEIDEATVEQVLTVFAAKDQEREVLDLFVIHDQLAGGEGDVSIAEVQRAMSVAEKLNATGARTYFAGVWCQKAAESGALHQAVAVAWDVLRQLDDIAAQDSEYNGRVGVTALLIRQLSEYLNDSEAVARINAGYANVIRDYIAQSSENEL